MSKLIVAFKNKKEPEQAPLKALSEILKEKWVKRDKAAAEKKYGSRKPAKPLSGGG